MIDYIILLIFIGILAGILSGLLGVGGGFLMVPLQYFLLISIGVDPDLALRISLGTSLAIIIPTSLSGAYNHNRNLNGILKIGIYLGLLGMVGGILGGFTSSYIPSDILSIILGIFLIIVAIIMLFNKKDKKPSVKNKIENNIGNNIENNIENNNENNIGNNIKNNIGDSIETNIKINIKDNIKNNSSMIICIFLGLLVGFSSGLLGIGGGIFLVPALNFLGFSMRKSIGVSSIFISLTAIGGTLSYIYTGLGVNTFPYSLGYISLINLGVIAIFSIPMAYLGAKLVYKISENKLNYIFVILMIYMGIRMLGFDPINFLLGLYY